MSNRKIAIVTGASEGIGKEAALLLAENGYHVYAVARRQALLDEIKSDSISPIALDVSDTDAVDSAVKQVLSEQGKIDLLVNNAGFAQLGAIECVSLEAVQRQFDVNLFGYVRFMQAVLPAMRDNKSGRIINVTSAVGKISMPLFGWYAGTKHAIEAISDALREEVRPMGIGVSIIEPGLIDTPFLGNQTDLLAETPHDPAYDHLLERLPSVVPPRTGGVHPKVIAESILNVAQAKKPPIRVALPADSKSVITLRKMVSENMFFSIMRKTWKL